MGWKLIWESTEGYQVFLVTTNYRVTQPYFSFSSRGGGSITPDEVLSMTAALDTAAFPLQKSLQKRLPLV